jgi:hypothetical protein
MTVAKHYSSARTFSQALDDHLRTLVKNQPGYDIARMRRQVAFDRLLGRLFQSERSEWILKGGYAMELRSDRARATRDVDLALPAGHSLLTNDNAVLGVVLQRELQRQAAHDPGDFFQFLISEPILDIEAAPYGGARFHIEARLDERTFSKFHLDVGVGDTILKPLDLLESRNWLAFAGIQARAYPTLSKEQQFAEKIHAYTLPREADRPNSRVKDLIDLILLIGAGDLDAERIKPALKATFRHRGTHSLPKEFPDPPKDWDKPFQRLAQEVGIETDLPGAVMLVRNYFQALGTK